jgi:hypothetical protein
MNSFDYKDVGVFVDSKGNIFANPSGIYTKRDVVVGLNILNTLKAPYSDLEIEQLIYKTLDQCYSEEIEELGVSDIWLKHFGFKSFSRVVKGLKSIGILWNKIDGCMITPTEKVRKQGFVHLVDKTKFLGHNPKEGEIAVALKQAIEESTTY